MRVEQSLIFEFACAKPITSKPLKQFDQLLYSASVLSSPGALLSNSVCLCFHQRSVISLCAI
ncbi:hypothetical protein CVE27_14405 [Pseudomonas syringae pv. actinidiae]|nr:hypothetical protein [Pseudomonas syringae pv. actinidiae]